MKTDKNKNIVFISYGLQVEGSYWSYILKGIEEVAREEGYDIILGSISPTDEEMLKLPNSVMNGSVDGIVLMGSLEKAYVEKVLRHHIPTVLIDTYSEDYLNQLGADIIMVDNEGSTRKITQYLIHQGIKNIGFIGDIAYSQSFEERWEGFLKAMKDADLEVKKEYCITHKEVLQYQHLDSIEKEIDKMKKLPEALVCANDRIAINVIRVLKKKGVAIPEDIAIVGFDNIAEAKIIEPPLTTVHIYKVELGKRTMDELIWRIKNPDYPYEVIRIMADIKVRKSTRS